MKLHLLGYSESSLSRILDVLYMSKHSDKVVIVTNNPIVETYPFAHPSLPYEVIECNEWQPTSVNEKFFPSVIGTGSKYAVYKFFHTQFGIDKPSYTNVIHPSSIISDTVMMGSGCFIEPAAIITSFAKIGFCVSINRGTTVGHHTVLGDFVTLNPGVHIAGHCKIGERTQIGIGSMVFNGVTIGSGSVIGGGSIVTKDIPDNVVAWGNPCKVIKQNAI